MKILHTEASPGWGGQELRILSEAEGMRERGHEIILVVQKGGGLVQPARKKGFLVYEVIFKKVRFLLILYQLIYLIWRHNVEIINTHSSIDAWIGGVAGRIAGCRLIRTRHLSTSIRKGLNSYLLYNWLADDVVTTCELTAKMIRTQANLSSKRCRSVPTGVNPKSVICGEDEVFAFREELGIKPGDCVVGTLCVLRGWKGVSDLLQAAKLLENVPDLVWIVVGSGVSESHFHQEQKKLGLEKKVFFTGHLSSPYTALGAMDIFTLLSWANEGVSQASLQAAWLEKPLITTPIGGLTEVCLDGKTGLQVPKYSPKAVAQAVKSLYRNPYLRKKFGYEAKQHVIKHFTFVHMLDKMESIYGKKHIEQSS